MTAQHPNWDKLWKRIQYLLQHNPAWLRKNINRRVKQIVCSARFVQQRQTNVALKHPDWNRVWKTVQYGDRNWLRNYIKSHDINQCRDEHGNTLLHKAAQRANCNAVRHLSDLCIDPNIKNAAGQTALQLAHDAECFDYLHRHHLCIDFDKASTQPNGLDALFAVIYRGDATLGDTSGVQDDGNEGNAGGWTALHCAAMYDRSHLIHGLHQRFPNLSMVNSKYHRSALHIAAKHGHANCIIALCECFPTIKIRGALHVACEYNRPACIPIFQMCFPHLTGNEMGNYSPALIVATLFNNPECIRALHSSFPDLDPNFQSNNPALITAVLHPDCLSALCECFPDIDPNVQDNKGHTALMLADSGPIIYHLLDFFPSIDPNIQSDRKDTALMRMSKSKDCSVDSIRHFLDTFPNVDVNIQTEQGNTALMIAIEKSNASLVALLLERFPNINPNFRRNDDATALSLALKCTDPNVLSLLCDRCPKLKINAQDCDGQTALMYAAKNGQADVIVRLKNAFPRLNPNLQDFQGYTALMHAAQCGDCAVLTALHAFPQLDPNVRGGVDRKTALMLAVESPDPSSILPVLCKQFPNIDPNLTTENKVTALMLAMQRCDVSCVATLLKLFSTPIESTTRNLANQTKNKTKKANNKKRQNQRLGSIFCSISTKLIRKLIAHLKRLSVTVDLKTRKSVNQTKNKTKKVRRIGPISYLIDPNIASGYTKNTALTFAIAANEPTTAACVSEFCNYFPNIDINWQNQQHQTALMLAVQRNNIDCVKLLFDRFPSIQPDLQNTRGYSALMLAAERQNIEMIILLARLFPHCNLKLCNNDGQTALMVAANQPCDHAIIALHHFPAIALERFKPQWWRNEERTYLCQLVRAKDISNLSKLLHVIAEYQ